MLEDETRDKYFSYFINVTVPFLIRGGAAGSENIISATYMYTPVLSVLPLASLPVHPSLASFVSNTFPLRLSYTTKFTLSMPAPNIFNSSLLPSSLGEIVFGIKQAPEPSTPVIAIFTIAVSQTSSQRVLHNL